MNDRLWTVEVEPYGTLGVFDNYADAEDFFACVQDPDLGLPGGQIQEFELGARDPQGFLRVSAATRRSSLKHRQAWWQSLSFEEGLR